MSNKPRRGRSRTVALLLTLLVLLGGSFIYGYVCSAWKLPPYSLVRKASLRADRQAWVGDLENFIRENFAERRREPGRWWPADTPGAGNGLNADQQAARERLLALGYLSGYEESTGQENVTRFEPGAVHEGLNLFTSGHAQAAYLMDMRGQIIHEWTHDFFRVFPEHKGPRSGENIDFWRRAHLFENGDLLAIYEGFGLIKLDKDSNLIWANPLGFHHDLFLGKNGEIYTLTHKAKVIPTIHKYEPVLEDFITILDPDGNVVREVSLLEAFQRSSFASFLDKMPRSGDIFHTNTIEVLDGSNVERSPIFKKGNVLISVLGMNVVAIVDMDTESVVWGLSGQWKRQHQPTLLDNGHLLVFDNLGNRGMSKVVEIDPLTQQIVWLYEGTEENAFRSRTCGSNQRLANGNTLITESDRGRAFEVTPDKRIVWEYYNPARAGERDELVATLFEMVRLDSDFPTAWLEDKHVH